MDLPKIPNLEIQFVTKDVLLVHQIKAPFHFSCCDGLIILSKKERNTKAIALDLNIEPQLIDKLNQLYGPFGNYVCSHGHMDHMAHVHHWEEIGALIHAPKPESAYLLNLHKFYEGFGFYEKLDFTSIEKFAEKNKYHPCKTVVPFELGAFLKFENVIIETIPFTGHSKGHVGFFLPNEKLLHISCLGFDKQNPNSDGFGPWYGFEECSIAQYLKDIELAKVLFLQRAEFLTSSHAYIVKNPDITPFTYMRKKFDENQAKIDHAVLALEVNNLNEIDIDALLELDLFFPKKKMNGFMTDLYRYWESKIINKHLKRSKYTTIE